MTSRNTTRSASGTAAGQLSPRRGRRQWLQAAALVAAQPSFALLNPLYAQGAQGGFPSRPVQIIVPFAAGGFTDNVARMVARGLAERWGTAVVVENRPGAGGNVGGATAATATPDGHTLFLANAATNGINPAIYRKMSFDALRDFAPISLIVKAPNVIAVNNDLPVRSVAELIALARAKPGTLNFGSPGNGTTGHLTGALFAARAGIEMVHVAYKGSPAVMTDLQSGVLQVAFDNVTSWAPQIQAGRMRAIAVTSEQRSSLLPDVPSIVEAGHPDVVATSWSGLAAPKGTPRPIVDRCPVHHRRAGFRQPVERRSGRRQLARCLPGFHCRRDRQMDRGCPRHRALGRMNPVARLALPVWRSLLFVPVTVARYVAKATTAGADGIILDLEDSVAAERKEEARARVAAAAAECAAGGSDVLVRINRPLRLAIRDIEASVAADVTALMLPKIESASHVRLLADVVDSVERERGLAVGSTRFLVVVEDVRALPGLHAIAAAHRRIVGLVCGNEDLAVSMGAEPDQDVLHWPKQQAVMAARSAGILPIGLFASNADFRRLDAYREAALRSRRFGVEGSSCIHPDQVPILNEVFSPSEAAVAAARRVVEAAATAQQAGLGAFALDGKMFDGPVVDRSRRILDLHARITSRPPR